MAYIKQTWQNNPPSATTPITATRLNHLETQYDEAILEVVSGASDPESAVGAAIETAVEERIDRSVYVIDGITTEALLSSMPPGVYIVEP